MSSNESGQQQQQQAGPTTPRNTLPPHQLSSTDDDSTPRPTLSPRASNSSLSSATSSASSPLAAPLSSLAAVQQQQRTPSPASPLERRPSGVYSTHSPLSASSSISRRRHDSLSSTVSTATEATSLESGEDNMSQEGGDKDLSTSPSFAAGGGSGSSNSSSAVKRSSSSAALLFGAPPGSQEWLATASTSSSSSASSSSALGAPSTSGPSSAISIPSASSLPISITTSVPPASVRLSTTPLFPSPLAQASGPDEDPTKGEDGDGESEDEDQVETWGRASGRHGSTRMGGSPLVREQVGPFGDIDISPTIHTVPLPDANLLGLDSSTTTPRAQGRSGHRRTPSARDSSPEVDVGRTARTTRIRSIGGRAGSIVGVSGLASGDEGSSVRRRSRTGESTFGSLALDTTRASQGSVTGSLSSSLPRSSSGLSISPSSSPSTPSSAAPGNSISRRASINLASPPRAYPPGSPTVSRNPRSVLSAQLASPSSAPYPAAPPPAESIKLQKVPESVRSALEFRQATAAAHAGESFSLPSAGFASMSPGDIRVPKTPVATRAPTPTSGSGSGSNSPKSGRQSISVSQASSRGPSRAPSRQPSRETLISPPSTSPVHINSHGSASSTSPSSAFSPLFPFPSTSASPASAGPSRTRSRSVYQPITAQPLASPSLDPFRDTSDSSSHDLGVSPLSLGLSPLALGAQDGIRRANSQRGGRGLLAAHRTSVAPTGGLGASTGAGGAGAAENTDEYAQIILASRNAKMRKWKTSTGSSNDGHARTGSWAGEAGPMRRGLPSFGEEGELVQEADVTPAEGEGFAMGVGNKEFEWVDWLDEYRKMKEAKLRAERNQTSEGVAEDAEGEQAAMASLPPRSQAMTDEYNPFEATTAGLNYSVAEAFLTPGPRRMHETFATSAVDNAGWNFQPKPTSAPTSVPVPTTEPFPLSRTATRSSGNTAISPGVKRRRNFNKLGTKIDAWWSAVRSSFSVTPEEESHERERHRRTSIDTSGGAPLASVASRTSSTFTRPAPVSRPSLRNVASAQDLSRPASTQPSTLTPPQEVSPSRAPKATQSPPTLPPHVVPAGALAPGARTISTGRLLPPKLQHRSSSGSSADSEGGGRSDSRWRNPGLSLNLGPSFNAMVQPKSKSPASRLPEGGPGPLATDSSTSAVSPNDSSRFFSPPLPASSMSATPSERVKSSNRPWPASTPGLTPGHPPMWDRTPDVVPSSTHFPVRNVPAVKNLKDPKEKAGPTFSMHTVRQQIRLRLVSAKENCDKELRKIIHGISTHVEVELHKDLAPSPAPGMTDDGRFNELTAEAESLFGAYGTQGPFEMDSESEALADVDDGVEETMHTDSDGGTSRPSSRMKSPLLSPGTSSTGTRRPSSGAGTRPRSPRRTSLAPRKRNLTSVPRPPDFTGYALSESKAKSGSASGATSRSSSRSRSPLPPALRNVSNGSRSPALSSHSNLPSSIAQSAFIVLLQEIITVATEILDTPVTKLTAHPGSCAEFIGRVQQIGKAWDDNPELACRGWYVQLLLAVAGLSRVLEWWEAERGFWTFDDNDDADAEPILFVAKPTAEESPEVRARGDSYSSSVGASLVLPPTSKWSPLGIDLGLAADGGGEEGAMGPMPSDADKPLEETTEQHAEALRQTVEEIRSSTLLMELSLDDQLFQFLSSAWEELVGINPADCLDTPIADFVFPDDRAVFAEATRQLEADDSHTVEVSFRLRVASSSQTSSNEEDASQDTSEDLYEAMEGKGMLMLDSLSGRPSHTMWVVRPAPLALDSTSGGGESALARYGFSSGHRRSASDPSMPFAPISHMISVEPVLCRICERATPVWFFEKHNETCNETHRLEGDIGECNDRLKELIAAVDDIATALDEAEGDEAVEYRGIPLLTAPSAPTPPTYLEGLKPPLSPRPPSAQLKKAQHRVLDQVHDVVQTAVSIATPSVLDETGDIPIQEQRLLSPHSENSLAIVMGWQRPSTDEPALARLIADTEEQIRFKLNSVNRLRNTILYAEKVRQEWELKANELLAHSRAQESQQRAPPWAESNSPFDSPALQPLPNDEASPRLIEGLDLPRPSQGLRRQSSHLFGLTSPNLSPSDGLPSSLGSPPTGPSLLSPRIPSGVPSSRTKASSIKDFKILKPISKGAFGSVYLAKKITTGDYYAIKTLKKSDMVAKNQVTNVKAERMILMTQTESDFVVKLYYTFQSKDYLYLVMEYLNGGDCAALVKNLGELPEEWARRYIAEVIVGLEYLHASGIVHRDLKPDNLLIDAKGHLKLTDFGLSRIGLLGRQTQMPSTRGQRRPSASARSASKDPNLSGASSPSSTPANALGQSPASYFGSIAINDSFSLDTPSSDSGSNSQHTSHKQISAAVDSLAASRASMPPPPPPERSSSRAPQSDTPPQKAFVGTPDYLAPESILGIGTDATVDWWALGVICYEFLYGFPPFHDETPEKVFENILSRRIEWHDEEVDFSPEARDFMERLLCSDAKRRLGANGAAEVKAHPFLDGVDWDNLLSGEVDFVPKVTDPENTDYFDARGATADQIFADDEPAEELKIEAAPTPSHPKASAGFKASPRALTPSTSASRQSRRERADTEPSPHDDFGTFTFRNLTVLKQANDDVIRKMRDEQLLPPVSALESPKMHARPLALGAKAPKSRNGSVDVRDPSSPSSPSTSSSSSAPSRPTAPSSPYTPGSTHSRRPSEALPAVERLRPRQPSVSSGSDQHSRRNSMPTRLRNKSMSEAERPAIPEAWGRHERRRTSNHTPPGSSLSSPVEGHLPLPPLSIPEAPLLPATTDSQASSAPTPISASAATAAASRLSTIDCLVAGRNPIVTKVLETMLIRLGCRCVVVPDGGEAILAAQGVAFDLIFCDLAMPVVDGETAARMIKSTNNPSQHCPIIAVCSHTSGIDQEVGTLFSGVLNKPIMKAQLLGVFQKLGFVFAEKGKNDERRGSNDDSRRGSEPHINPSEERRGST